MAEVGFVAGATHIELTYGVLDFDFDGLDYDLHLAAPMVLEPDTLPSGLGTQICVLGIRFYQEVDGALYVLNAKESVGIAVLKCI
ncbi:hypothetical protein [Winogradskyella thalassocola]|uniref:Uncharacterized protein n=1 Tax=Winogradskyella thalassocola TaxID=262004 RepID=A0A1G8GGI7_9FLAO|nr:hypothetical protein [Winogradskyella thalassocola]SDH93461.1 hypothetical protein SAMN04489796_105206 [Winogradskyella thalassocola]